MPEHPSHRVVVLSPKFLAAPMYLWRRQLEAQIADPHSGHGHLGGHETWPRAR